MVGNVEPDVLFEIGGLVGVKSRVGGVDQALVFSQHLVQRPSQIADTR